MAVIIKCPKSDCFQNFCGMGCKLLSSPMKKDHPCPFYKTQEEVDFGRRKAHKHLEYIERYDLIETYEYNPERRW